MYCAGTILERTNFRRACVFASFFKSLLPDTWNRLFSIFSNWIRYSCARSTKPTGVMLMRLRRTVPSFCIRARKIITENHSISVDQGIQVFWFTWKLLNALLLSNSVSNFILSYFSLSPMFAIQTNSSLLSDIFPFRLFNPVQVSQSGITTSLCPCPLPPSPWQWATGAKSQQKFPQRWKEGWGTRQILARLPNPGLGLLRGLRLSLCLDLEAPLVK